MTVVKMVANGVGDHFRQRAVRLHLCARYFLAHQTLKGADNTRAGRVVFLLQPKHVCYRYSKFASGA
jgi:hypothetical protein